jgi:hypothetical protein
LILEITPYLIYFLKLPEKQRFIATNLREQGV